MRTLNSINVGFKSMTTTVILRVVYSFCFIAQVGIMAIIPLRLFKTRSSFTLHYSDLSKSGETIYPRHNSKI